MSVSFPQLLIVALMVVLLFGRGKISGLMGDLAQGIKAFKKGMAEDPALDAPVAAQVEAPKAEQTKTG